MEEDRESEKSNEVSDSATDGHREGKRERQRGESHASSTNASQRARPSVVATFLIIVLVAVVISTIRRRQARLYAEQAAFSAPVTLPPAAFPIVDPTPAPLPNRQVRIVPPIKRVNGNYPAEPSGDIVDYLIERFVLGYGRAIRVCENLAVPQGRVPSSMMQLEADIRVSERSGNSSDNRFIESAMIPIATALEMPSFGGMVEAVQTAKNMQDPRQIRGDGFRSLVSLAAAEAITNRAELSRRAQHAYHLYTISRAVFIVPSLATSGEVLTLCAHEQLLATSSTSEAPEQVDADKTSLLRLLATAGISPEQVGFDPNLRNDVTIEASVQGVSINVPWLVKQFGSTMHIENPVIAEPELVSGATTSAGTATSAGEATKPSAGAR